jgi:hypothetical protein
VTAATAAYVVGMYSPRSATHARRITTPGASRSSWWRSACTRSGQASITRMPAGVCGVSRRCVGLWRIRQRADLHSRRRARFARATGRTWRGVKGVAGARYPGRPVDASRDQQWKYSQPGKCDTLAPAFPDLPRCPAATTSRLSAAR